MNEVMMGKIEHEFKMERVANALTSEDRLKTLIAKCEAHSHDRKLFNAIRKRAVAARQELIAQREVSRILPILCSVEVLIPQASQAVGELTNGTATTTCRGLMTWPGCGVGQRFAPKFGHHLQAVPYPASNVRRGALRCAESC